MLKKGQPHDAYMLMLSERGVARLFVSNRAWSPTHSVCGDANPFVFHV